MWAGTIAVSQLQGPGSFLKIPAAVMITVKQFPVGSIKFSDSDFVAGNGEAWGNVIFLLYWSIVQTKLIAQQVL